MGTGSNLHHIGREIRMILMQGNKANGLHPTHHRQQTVLFIWNILLSESPECTNPDAAD